MTIVKNISTSLEVIEESNINEPHLQYDLQTYIDYPFQSVEEIEDLGTTFDGENPLEPEIEEFLTLLSSNILSTHEINYPME